MTGPFYTRIAVDTCVFSYVFKEHLLAIDFLPYLDSRQCFLSFMAIAELFHGAYKDNWGHDRRVKLQEAIDNYSIIPANDKVARNWAYITSYCERNGRTIPIKDSWHAACAITYNFPFLTNNAKDFENIPSLKLIGPNLQ
jgi:predicted nucleic acid-binding protein